MTLGFPGGLRRGFIGGVRRTLGPAVLSAAILIAPAARAETLLDTLAATYYYNPRLDAERARLRATDEGVATAMSGYRPNITFNADAGHQHTEIRPDPFDRSSGETNPKGYSFQFIQPLFRGFQTTNAVNEAESQVRAGREVLRNVEQEVLLAAVESFVDVLRDQEIVRLSESNLSFFNQELQATRDRFAVGEVTRTDVAQAEAKRAQAVGDLDVTRATLKASRAIYQQTVGQEPRKLVSPGLSSKLLPSNIGEAIGTSSKENPLVVAALYNEQAARFVVEKTRGELLPEAQLEASYQERWELSRQVDKQEVGLIRGQISVPIYEGGQVYSRVRAAKHQHLARIQEIEQNRALAQAQVSQAWARLQGAKAQLESDKAQIEANQVALNGVREEEKVGQRQLLDVLEAQVSLINSQVQFERTKRNVIAFTYAVVSGMGRLNVAELGAVGMSYDPEAHYFEVRRKWIGTDITHDDERRRGDDGWNATVERAPPPAKAEGKRRIK